MYKLQTKDNRLELINTENKQEKPIYVDFCSGSNNYRRLQGGGRKQALIKAIGLKGSFYPSVIDATAGFGTDSFVMASFGCKVQMIERSNTIAKLLENGLQRANSNTEIASIISHLQLIKGNAFDILKALPRDQYPDIIYLDPMFPENPKGTLVKKEMIAIRSVLATEQLDFDLKDNDIELLNLAREIAEKRVVVKRPSYAEPIGNIKPSHQLLGKSNRFDVYL